MPTTFSRTVTYVAAVFYGAVSALGFPAFETRQCCVGCNDSMCDNAGYPTPFLLHDRRLGVRIRGLRQPGPRMLLEILLEDRPVDLVQIVVGEECPE